MKLFKTLMGLAGLVVAMTVAAAVFQVKDDRVKHHVSCPQ